MRPKFFLTLCVLSFIIFTSPSSPAEETSNSSEVNSNVASKDSSAPIQNSQENNTDEVSQNKDDQTKNADIEEAPQQESQPPQINSGTDIAGRRFSGTLLPTVDVDPNTGSASINIPIEVPPGRGGIQPSFSLNYNSNTRNGPLGVGWSLGLAAIERSTKKGVPQYDDNDTFILTQPDSTQELVYDSSKNFYRTKIDGYWMKIEKISNFWRMIDKNGIQYTFGEDKSSREYDPNDSDRRIFKWCLNKVEDPFGNFMKIVYWPDGGDGGNTLYPQSIEYTGNDRVGLPIKFASVEFQWEIRSDKLSTGYSTGYLTRTHYRLKQIDVYAKNTLQSSYILDYKDDESPITGRSLISTITQSSAYGQSLPPLNLEYYASAVQYSGGRDGNLGNTVTSFFGDFNGDGRTDKARYYFNDGTVTVSLSNGQGFRGFSDWLTGGPTGSLIKPLTGNFDNDGYTDLCIFNPTEGKWLVYTSNGQNRFESKWTWTTDFGQYKDAGTGDFNGDGLTDLVSFENTGQAMKAKFALNMGNRFETAGAEQTISSTSGMGITGDFNGDGLTDLGVWAEGLGFWEIRLNSGNIVNPFVPMFSSTDFGRGKNNIIADFNYDGMTDIGYYYNDNQTIVYRLSTGNDFVWPPKSTEPLQGSTGAASAVISSADFNGDGLLDFITLEPLQNNTYDLHLSYSQGTFPDLLKTSQNGIGGITTIEYAPSTSFDNAHVCADNPNQGCLPFSLQLVKSSTVDNNRGNRYTTRYEYALGYWEGKEREFRGFGKVKIFDPDNNYSETLFETGDDILRTDDDFIKGRVLEQAGYEASGRLFSKTINAWKARPITADGQSQFVSLEKSDQFIYDTYGQSRHTSQSFEYDPYGNISKSIQWGDESDGDERCVVTRYINSEAPWRLALPMHTSIYAGKDESYQVMRQNWFYYDNLVWGSASNGLLSKKEDWLGFPQGDAGNPATTYNYDAAGNLTSTTDPIGNTTPNLTDHTTTITYDSVYRMFPLITENALGHKVFNEYYGINGVPLGQWSQGECVSEDKYCGSFGQLKSVTDPNSQTVKKSYDEFGRLIKTVSPLDTIELPTTLTKYEFFTDYVQVTQHSRMEHGKPETINTVQFYDGLGQLIQNKRPSERYGEYIVSGQVSYNTRGLVEKQFLPYFTSNDLDTMDPPPDGSRLYSKSTYDAQARVTRIDNPDQKTFNQTQYTVNSVTAIDENNHVKKNFLDAYGRLIQADEFTGVYPNQTHYASTYYKYDSEGNLVEVKDAHNNVTSISYDQLGRKIQMIDPDMGTWTYEYDLNGNLMAQKDAKGQISEKKIEFQYDDLNRLNIKTHPDNLNVKYLYDEEDVPNSIGRLTKVTYGEDSTQFFYDVLGRETESIKNIDQMDYRVGRNYNALNNLKDIQYPDQEKVFYQYNLAGQIERVSKSNLDANNTPAAHYWLNDNAPDTLVDDATVNNIDAAASGPTNNLSDTGKINQSLHFDGVEDYVQLDNLLNAAKNDAVGSFAFWVNPDVASRTVFSFGDSQNAEGPELMTFGIGEGTFSFHMRLPNGDLIKGFSSDSRIQADHWTHFTVVQDGSRIKFYVNAQEADFNWTSENNPGAWFNDLPDLDNGRLACTNYESQGNFDFFKGRIDDFRYYSSALDKPTIEAICNNEIGTEEEDPLGGGNPADSFYIKNVDYNEYGQTVLIEYGNNVQTAYAYDLATLRLTRLLTKDASDSILQDLSYTYDSVGNITHIADAVNTSTQDFRYDALNRLVYAKGSYGEKNYSYDEIGNITEKDGLRYCYGTDQSCSPGAIAAGPHAVTSLSDGSLFKYDANGNMEWMVKDGKTIEYAYDIENRLTEVKVDGQKVQVNVFDGDGARTKKINFEDAVNSQEAKKKFGFGAWERNYHPVVADFSLREGSPVADGKATPLHQHTSEQFLGETTTYVGSLFERRVSLRSLQDTRKIFLGSMQIAAVTGDKVVYYHPDHLGSTNVVTDKDGKLQELFENDPWGTVVRDDKYGTDQDTLTWYFTGKPQDKETGLIFFGARFYDPSLGRFLTPDTIVQNPYDPQTLNRYSYTSNNPINRIDPDGRGWFKKFFQKWGDFISPLGRAIVTGDWKNFGFQVLNMITITVGVMTANPWMVTAGILSYSSRATSHIGDNVSEEISRALGYASTAVSVIDTGINLANSVKDWSAASKLDSRVQVKIGEVSKLEKTAENVEKLEKLNQFKKFTGTLEKALAIKPLATIGGAAAGVAISGGLSDWDAKEMLKGSLTGASLGYFTSGTRIGFTQNFRMELEPWFQGVKSFHAELAIETKIYGINVKSMMPSWNWTKEQGWSNSIDKINYDQQINWSPILF